MPRYRVYVVEEGSATRSVSIDYIADSAEAAAQMYRDWDAFEDYSVDDNEFDIDSWTIEDVQPID